MVGVNKAIVVGHVGADPEIRRTESGRPVATFSLATSEAWRDKTTGERKERTQWHRIVVFNEALCGVCEQYVRKGSKLYVEGSIQTRKWTDQGGVDRYVTEIVLSAFHSQILLLDRREGAPPAQSESDYGVEKPRADAPSAAAAPGLDDEIPF
jgi:single-strand DNA-binding protein